jgi:hypothetical protein
MILTRALVAAVFLGAIGNAVGQSATAPVGNPTLAQQLQQLQAVVAALQTTINQIQASVTTIETSVGNIELGQETNLRFTTPIFLPDNGGALCSVANVDTVPHKVKLELIRDTGAVQGVFLSGNFALDAGEATGGSQGSLPRGPYYCRATVLDGTRADIRSGMQALPLPGISVSPSE